MFAHSVCALCAVYLGFVSLYLMGVLEVSMLISIAIPLSPLQCTPYDMGTPQHILEHPTTTG